MFRTLLQLSLVSLATAVLVQGLGCASEPTAVASEPNSVATGFLRDYSRLEMDGKSRARFLDARLAEYETFIVDPIEVRVPRGRMSEEDLAVAVNYFRDSLTGMIERQGLTVTDDPGVKVARIRTALTNIAQTTWGAEFYDVRPALGTAGAAMEAEVRDSITGEQLAAVVQVAEGDQLDVGTYSALDDVKAAIDNWTRDASERLVELRDRAKREDAGRQ